MHFELNPCLEQRADTYSNPLGSSYREISSSGTFPFFLFAIRDLEFNGIDETTRKTIRPHNRGYTVSFNTDLLTGACSVNEP